MCIFYCCVVMGVGSEEGVSHSPVGVCFGFFEVFCVKEYILVHFSHRNISNFLASFVPLLPQKALLLMFPNCILQCNSSGFLLHIGALEVFSE